MCDAYLAAGARGLSLLFSSGDGGVSGGQSQGCTTFIPTQVTVLIVSLSDVPVASHLDAVRPLIVRSSDNAQHLFTAFVTSVGATQSLAASFRIFPFLSSFTGINPEVVASFSGGGFSNFFTTPDFQSTQVAAYLESIGTLNQGLFNASGRAFPDVALQGVNFEIAVGGEFGLVDGTSCSTPTLAGIFALVNDQLLAAGKPTLGFLNPLYETYLFIASCVD